jgi:SAM-dependent methyltransferase
MNWFYNNREERSRWLVERFHKEFESTESVLDLGCYNSDLKLFLSQTIKYTGVDIIGKPDLIINLDKIEKLPFDDESFDTVVCADVLEHLENLHLIFDEACRVTKKFVIITLPNPFSELIGFFRGKKYSRTKDKRMLHGKYSKFYGLPLEKPEDRHRWFFSFDEAEEFIEYRSSKNGMRISSIENEFKYLKESLIKNILLFPIKIINKHLIAKHMIILLTKS